MKRLFQRDAPPARAETSLDAERGRVLVEESREIVVVLDAEGRVVTASRRARELFDALSEGEAPPEAVLRDSLAVAYNVAGAARRWSTCATPATSPPTRSFAPASPPRSRTSSARRSRGSSPCSRSATLPDADQDDLIDQAQAEVRQIGELIDDVLFLSELESGRELVALGSTVALPILEEVVESLGENAARAGLTLRAEGDPEAELPLRPADDPRHRGEPRRERHPLRRPRLDVHAHGPARRADRFRRRRRGRRGRPAAPLRALLPRRPRTRLARDRASGSRS